jgi:hypothetical protein
MSHPRPRLRLVVPVLGLALVLTACASGAPTPSIDQPGPTDPPSSAAASAPDPTAVPNPGASDPAASGDTGGGSSGGGSGGGSTGGPGTGILDPGQIGGIFFPDGPADPNGEPTLVGPVGNVRDVRDVSAVRLEVSIDGREAAARVSWWSGVEPCYALAGIAVERTDGQILLTVKEGSAGAPDTMCTEQAIYKAAVIDLGELEPGSWTIRAFGEAPPVEVTVQG